MNATEFRSRFLAYAKGKPAHERYGVTDGNNCALGQFVRNALDAYRGEALGYRQTKDSLQVAYPNDCYEAAIAGTVEDLTTADYTWGELVKRLEALNTEALS